MNELNRKAGHYIDLNGKSYTCFAGNDYLGLAHHPEVIGAAHQALIRYGVNFSASRQTTGTSEIHLELEALLARYKGTDEAIVFASGFLGNYLLFRSLKERYDHLYVDSQAHPSIYEGLPCGVSITCFDHCNANHLDDLLRNKRDQRPLIITDGVFALTGEIAPVDEIWSVAERYHALLIVDDAHGTGVLGGNGRGTPEHFHLDGQAGIYQSETMSKALGSYGGFIAANRDLVRDIRLKSSFYGASTALPPPITAAACASVRLIHQHPELRQKLKINSERIRKEITELGFSTSGKGTPIIPLLFKEQRQAKSLSDYLKENNIIAPAVDYPVKTDYFIVRITASTNHTAEQIEYLLTTLKGWRDNNVN